MQRCLTEEEISRYLDGEFAPREARAAAAHIEKCPACGALCRKLRASGRALETWASSAVPPDRKRGEDCPDEGLLAAFADGSIREINARRGIAAHLARCARCSRIAAEAARAADLAGAAQRGKPDPVPARLHRMIEERFFPRPVSLGRIEIDLAEIWGTFARWVRPRFPGQLAYAISPDYLSPQMAAEDRVPYSPPEPGESAFREAKKGEPENRPGERKAVRKVKRPLRTKPLSRAARLKSGSADNRPSPCPRWSFERGDLRVSVEVADGKEGEGACRIDVTDRRGCPLSGVPLVLEKSGQEIWSDTTQLKKESIFPHLVPGQYRLIITGENVYSLDLDIK
ncbi:MAG: zf-HC2 domain-containing protein [PVC group bacterium]